MDSNQFTNAAERLSASQLFKIAVDAVEFTLPLYEMARMSSATAARIDRTGRLAGDSRESTLRWANQWAHSQKLLGPNDRHVVTPNNDTLYSSGWFDLSNGPVLLKVPDTGSRYYVLGLLDMYTNPFGYIGSRTTGSSAGTFLLHGPGWEGEVPPGVRVLSCPTNTVWAIGRILVDGEKDVPAALALQDQLVIESMPGSDTWVPDLIETGMQPSERIGDPVRYAQIVNRVLASNPPPPEAINTVERFAACGIGPACRDTPLSDAQRDALDRAIRSVTHELRNAPPAELGGGWALPVDVSESFGTDYHRRAQVALNYIGALGIQEAMYIVADCDASGVLLDGDVTYVLRFPAGGTPQVSWFWSLTAYEKASCMLVENAIGRYSLGDRTRGLVRDADGGLRIAISAREPAEPTLRSNWLPAPRGRFYLALRLYGASAEHLTRAFAYPPIERCPF